MTLPVLAHTLNTQLNRSYWSGWIPAKSNQFNRKHKVRVSYTVCCTSKIHCFHQKNKTIKVPQWCHKSLSFLLGGLCGQSTRSSLRFNISLEKEPQRCVDACSKTITQKSHLGATRFLVCLLTTLPILDFDVFFLLLEDKNVSPAVLVQNHHCTSVPVHSPQYAGSCPLAQHFFLQVHVGPVCEAFWSTARVIGLGTASWGCCSDSPSGCRCIQTCFNSFHSDLTY